MREPLSDDVLEVLGRVSPGTPLREAVELILHHQIGALVVVGAGAVVDGVSSGGFKLDEADFKPQRIAELAKMDGGIVLDDDAESILRANVHFLPDPSIGTDETGTRHRTAERMARQTGKPVIAVSEGRRMAVVYLGSERIELRSSTALLASANQTLTSLERLRRRLNDAEERLTRFEVDDLVVVGDVVVLLQRATLMRRLQSEMQRLAVELGDDSQLIHLQANDLFEGVEGLAASVYEDYSKRRPRDKTKVLTLLDEVSTEELFDPTSIVNHLKLSPIEAQVRPRGLRMLSRVPKLPDSVKESLVSHFGDFQKMLRAEVGDLDQVEGVGPTRAMQLRTYFDRLLEIGTAWAFDE